MAGTLQVRRVDANAGGRTVRRQWVFVPSGSYAQSSAVGVAGETLNFLIGTTGGIVATNPKGKPRASMEGGFSADDFTVERVPGGYTGLLEANAVSPGFNNLVLRYFTTAGTEVSSGAYPAGLLGDTVISHVSDKKNG